MTMSIKYYVEIIDVVTLDSQHKFSSSFLSKVRSRGHLESVGSELGQERCRNILRQRFTQTGQRGSSDNV